MFKIRAMEQRFLGKTIGIGIFTMFIAIISASANIKLPRLISDGIVLQRGVDVPIWGWAEIGEKVTVSFKGQQFNTTTGSDKKWKVQLPQQKAGGPFEITIKGSNTITIKNILFGDVWFCSGQSNMEYEMYKAADIYPKEIASSTNDLIRHFLVKRNIGFNALEDIESDAGWQSTNPTTVLNFTAVGYFFARNIFEKYHVPIGLIHCSYGGTPAEAWINENNLTSFPSYYEKAILYKDAALVEKLTEEAKAKGDNWLKNLNAQDAGWKEGWQKNPEIASGWKTMQVPGLWQDQGLNEKEGAVVWFSKKVNIPAKFAGKAATLMVGNIVLRDNTYFNGVQVGTTSNRYAPRKYAIAGNLVKEGNNTITVRIINEAGNGGFIPDKPYQLLVGDTAISLMGEWQYKQTVSVPALNRDDVIRFQIQPTAMYYGMLEPLIGAPIKGVLWYQGESNVSKAKEYQTLFPTLINSWRAAWKQGDFPFLYVQLANNNPAKKMPSESKLAELQEAQSMALELPNTGMAVANDVGEWNDVHYKNKSAVGERLALVAEKLVYGEKNIIHSGPVLESYTIKGNQVILSFSNVGGGLITKDGGPLQYFSIAEANKKFVWANAKIEGNTIVVWNDNISNPVAVRYAWADNPAGANLYNKEGLPASSFRTDKNLP
jgi:sialate O-acetylesterase